MNVQKNSAINSSINSSDKEILMNTHILPCPPKKNQFNLSTVFILEKQAILKSCDQTVRKNFDHTSNF